MDHHAGEGPGAARQDRGRGTRRLLLLLFVVALWGPTTVHPGHVNYDTPWLVVDNPVLRTGSLPAIWTDLSRSTRLALGAEYLPVRDTTVLLDFALWGDRWAGHHLQNLAWWALGCLLLQALFERALGPGRAAFLAALGFAAHPIHVESVAWLASRKDVVSLALGAGFLLAWLRGRTSSAALLLLSAIWAKNTAITLPGVALAWEVLLERRRPRLRRWLLPALVCAVTLAISLHVGREVAMMAPRRGGTLAASLLLETRVIWRDVALLAWPLRLAPFYPEPTPLPLLHPRSLASLGGAVALLAAIPLTARRAPLVALGIAWAGITLLPVSQLVPIQNLLADRYLLWPSAGGALALAGLARLLSPGARRRLLPVAVGIVLAWVPLTARQALTWRDSRALWTHAWAARPESPRNALGLAGLLEAEGELQAAEHVLAEALERHPDHPLLLQARGRLAMRRGDLGRAEADLRRAWTLDDDRRQAAHNLAILLARTGRLPGALQLLERLVRLHPLYAEAWNTLGVLRLERGELEAAESALARAEALAPGDPRPPCNRGAVAWRAGRTEDAGRHWQRCLALDPGSAPARRGLERLGAHEPTAPPSTPR